METAKKNIIQKSIHDWIIESWKTILTILGVVGSVFWGGYKTSEFFQEEKLERERIKMTLQCTEQIHQIEAKFQEEKAKSTDTKVDNLIEAVKNIQEKRK